MEGEGKEGIRNEVRGCPSNIRYPLNKVSLTEKPSFLSIIENLESSRLKKTLKKKKEYFHIMSLDSGSLAPDFLTMKTCYLQKPLKERVKALTVRTALP